MSFYQIQEAGERVALVDASTPAQALQSLNDDPTSPFIYDADGVEILPVPVGGGYGGFDADCNLIVFGEDSADLIETARAAIDAEGLPEDQDVETGAFVASISPSLRQAFEAAGFRADTVIEPWRRRSVDFVAFLDDGLGDSVAYAMTVSERAAFADA